MIFDIAQFKQFSALNFRTISIIVFNSFRGVKIHTYFFVYNVPPDLNIRDAVDMHIASCIVP